MAYIALAYEHFLCEEIELALESVGSAETKFKSLSKNDNIHSLSPAFSHVLHATKAALLLRKGETNQVAEVSVFTVFEPVHGSAMRK